MALTSTHRKQLTLAVSDFERYRKPTRPESFLAEMDSVVPWKALAALIDPFYPKSASAGGCPGFGLGRMLRIHCLQLGFDLSDPVVEETLYFAVTPANTRDNNTIGHLLRGHEMRVYGDQAYKSQGEVIRARAPKAKDVTNQQCKWKHFTDESIKAKNRTNSRIRSRVEHSIGVIKRVFGFGKVRYRGMAKNANRVYVTAALANIFLVRYSVLGAVRLHQGKEAKSDRFFDRTAPNPINSR